ncbi:Ser/Thr protein phosphatase superfamily [Pyrenochaeta sp. MPI-SDFR-AT-0127]|nr:Ser/Thr protein phosphatase superfamily [Pyrenochaeta sp. MPI-SDFR-AT-0127]
MELLVLSDLHLETPSMHPTYVEFTIPPSCPSLALLGDIGLASDPRLFDFLSHQLKQFETVLFVMGNHEAYDTSYAVAKSSFQSFSQSTSQRRRSDPSLGRFIFLDQTRFDVNDSVTILGCTLFSAIFPEQKQSVQSFVSDFERVKYWTVEDHNAAHASDLAWLNKQVINICKSEPHRDVIVVTHYSPTISPKATDSRHLDDAFGIRSAFMTDLSTEPCWTAPAVKIWAFGHTHFNCDFVDETTGKRVLTNQKGYARSNTEGFDVDKVVVGF